MNVLWPLDRRIAETPLELNLEVRVKRLHHLTHYTHFVSSLVYLNIFFNTSCAISIPT